MALSDQEKGALQKLITKGTQVISSSIAQVHLGSPDPNLDDLDDPTGLVATIRENGDDKWLFSNIEGALLFEKETNGLMFFRVYELNKFSKIFEVELYEDMPYEELTPHFHCFEMEPWMCGFSFSSEPVAKKFLKRVKLFQPKAPEVSPQSAPPRSQNAAPPLPSKANTMRKNDAPELPSKNKAPKLPMKKTNSKAYSENSTSSAGKGNMYLGNGMLDPDNVPIAWKKLLKKAGLKKRDLKNPAMFKIIEETLAAHNIALDPPKVKDYNDPRLLKYYTKEQIASLKKYEEDMRAYEADQIRYKKEMGEYQAQQNKQKKFQQAVLRQSAARPMKQLQNMAQPAQPAPKLPKKHQQLPRASVARPVKPALPPVPETKEEKIARMMKMRQSRVIVNTGMLAGIQGGISLKSANRASVALPDIAPSTGGGLLETLKAKLEATRGLLQNSNNEDDDDSEWDEE